MLRVFGQDLADHIPGFACELAAVFGGDHLRPLDRKPVVGIERDGTVVGVYGFVVLVLVAVGATQQHPALGIVRIGLELGLELLGHGGKVWRAVLLCAPGQRRLYNRHRVAQGQVHKRTQQRKHQRHDHGAYHCALAAAGYRVCCGLCGFRNVLHHANREVLPGAFEVGWDHGAGLHRILQFL